jgi:hypothetical protein
MYHQHTIKQVYNSFNLTLPDKVSSPLMKLYFHIMELVEGAKWYVITLSEFGAVVYQPCGIQS